MSGDGVVSVRLPRSLLGMFRAATERPGSTIHGAARILIAAAASLTQDEITELKEPPRELDSPRISLYVGLRYVDALCANTQNSALTNSGIFRRLLYALIVTREVQLLRYEDHWRLRITQTKQK
jgi:hypothetical protein